MTRLTDHFTLEELRGVDAPGFIRENLTRLAVLLEACRALWGGHPVVITSGYRTEMQNSRAHGSKGSQHLTGQAADLTVLGVSPRAAWRLLHASDIQVGQAIVYGLKTTPRVAGAVDDPSDGSGSPDTDTDAGTFLHVSLPRPGLLNDFLWTPAHGGSGGPYYPVPRGRAL